MLPIALGMLGDGRYSNVEIGQDLAEFTESIEWVPSPDLPPQLALQEPPRPFAHFRPKRAASAWLSP
jgi:hypothetical protein